MSSRTHRGIPQYSASAHPVQDKRLLRDRRKRPTPALSRYIFHGRRKANRRENDPRHSYFVDRYRVELCLAVIAVFLLSMLDAHFTLILLENGGRELNPLMAWAIGINPWFFLCLKFTMTGLGLVALCLLQNYFLSRKAMAGLLAVYSFFGLYHIYNFLS